VRRKVVNRVKFKSTQIRLAFKVPFHRLSSPRFCLHPRANFKLTRTGKKSLHGEQLNRYEIKFPLLADGERGSRYTSKLGPCQVDKLQIVEEQLPVVMRSTHMRHDFSLSLSLSLSFFSFHCTSSHDVLRKIHIDVSYNMQMSIRKIILRFLLFKSSTTATYMQPTRKF